MNLSVFMYFYNKYSTKTELQSSTGVFEVEFSAHGAYLRSERRRKIHACADTSEYTT